MWRQGGAWTPGGSIILFHTPPPSVRKKINHCLIFELRIPKGDSSLTKTLMGQLDCEKNRAQGLCGQGQV